MIRATRMASMKIKANAKAAFGFLKKLVGSRFREGCRSFLADDADDLCAMAFLLLLLRFVAEDADNGKSFVS